MAADRSKNNIEACTGGSVFLAYIWMLVSVISLIYSGATIVGPYRTYSNWNITNCMIMDVKLKGMTSCYCGGYCTAEYPCYDLKVIYAFSGEQHLNSLFYSHIDLEDKNQVSFLCFLL